MIRHSAPRRRPVPAVGLLPPPGGNPPSSPADAATPLLDGETAIPVAAPAPESASAPIVIPPSRETTTL